ncbi:MAG: hypothetical protein LC624_00900 [Halobacteriales archaeon]|nr:hypothetical protein [Halobacteriales archaeon]
MSPNSSEAVTSVKTGSGLDAKWMAIACGLGGAEAVSVLLIPSAGRYALAAMVAVFILTVATFRTKPPFIAATMAFSAIVVGALRISSELSGLRLPGLTQHVAEPVLLCFAGTLVVVLLLVSKRPRWWVAMIIAGTSAATTFSSLFEFVSAAILFVAVCSGMVIVSRRP